MFGSSRSQNAPYIWFDLLTDHRLAVFRTPDAMILKFGVRIGHSDSLPDEQSLRDRLRQDAAATWWQLPAAFCGHDHHIHSHPGGACVRCGQPLIIVPRTFSSVRIRRLIQLSS